MASSTKDPVISIVIPNYQGGNTLPDCLTSIVKQNYQQSEIIVIDGASTDNSVDVIHNFESHISNWVSEPDLGQADALNKGFAQATGDIWGWLCSDDILLPETLPWVADFFVKHPNVDMVIGAVEMEYTNEPDRNFTFYPPKDAMDMLPSHNGIIQPGCFWRASAIKRSPPIDASYCYAMDNELWCYLKKEGASATITQHVLSRFIQDGQNKTSSGGKAIGHELDRLYRAYSHDFIPLSFWYRNFRYPFECLFGRRRGWWRLALLRPIQLLYMILLSPFYGYKRVRRMSWPD